MTPIHLEQLAAEIQERWAGGEPPDALAALAAHPELAACKPLVLELAFEEFSLRAEAGAPPDPVTFAARLPFATDIAALLAVHSVLDRKWSSGSSRRPKVALHPGDTVGDLLVLRLLGRGGFSDVYLVRNAAVGDRTEVLKVSTRGAEEARTLGPLAHPHLMPVFAAPTVNGHRAVASPYLGLATGETLVARAAGRTPTTGWLLRVVAERRPNDPPVTDRPAFPLAATPYPRAVLHIAAAVAGVLKYLHAEGIAHRDLKPSNLLFGPTGFPYLLDLNLADDGRGGRGGGTVAYAPPEVLARLRGDTSGAVDWQAADVFSFAVLVFELLLVRHPYLVGEALARIDADTVPTAARSARGALAALRLPLPPAVRTLLLNCLSADPADRPTADALTRVLSAAVAPRQRHGWALAAAAVLVATGGVAAGGWAAQASAAPPQAPFVEDRAPTDPFDRGVWLVKRDQPDVAVVAFGEAVRTDHSGRSAEWLSYCHARCQNPAAVIKYADDAETAGRKTVAMYANRAVAKMLTGHDAGAAADAAEALKLDDTCHQARLTRGLMAYRLHSREVAVPRGLLVELDAALPGNGDHAGLWLNLAEARARVVNRGPADDARVLAAVRESLRCGGKRSAVAENAAITAALQDDPKYAATLATPAERAPATIDSQLVMPD